MADDVIADRYGFQPTLPLRGATLTTCVSVPASVVFQPTLPLRGATGRGRAGRVVLGVSTHAPLAGSDPYLPVSIEAQMVFQPTLPLRGAT